MKGLEIECLFVNQHDVIVAEDFLSEGINQFKMHVRLPWAVGAVKGPRI